MANDGKDLERMNILSARFVQIQLMPAEVSIHPMALMALDERGRVWDYNFEHKVWTMLGTNRALPAE